MEKSYIIDKKTLKGPCLMVLLSGPDNIEHRSITREVDISLRISMRNHKLGNQLGEGDSGCTYILMRNLI